MKIEGETFNALRDAIAALDTAAVREAYRAGKFRNADRCKDRDLRYRWDLFFASAKARAVIYGTSGQVNPNGYTDAHIDTALRRIVPPLEAQP